MHLPINILLQGGKYKIIRFINSGGFGCTYEAEHVMLEKRVAIKEFFVKDFCNRDETTAHVTVGTLSKKGLVEKLRRKFVDEAKALCRLQHPSIVRVSDVFEENGTAYFVMDYIHGRSLSEIVSREGPLTEQRALKYIRQVGEALQYVHEHSRLHLDLKPGNIMIDGNDHAMLIDFGASKQYDEEDGENTSTLLGKTPGYAPLEQMGNDVVKFMPATDIYALGATLYKLLTGITPLSATLLASGEELAPLPSTISVCVGKAIACAMKINKSKRPQTVKEFFSLLEGVISDNDLTILDVSQSLTSLNPRIVEESKVTASIGQTPTHTSSGGIINGHEYIDLGLSVKWATCNIGASTSFDCGNYYAWGEVLTKTVYTLENSLTHKKSMGDISGDLHYDAARVNWGEPWRLPTFSEVQELKEKCKWKWITEGGYNGYRVTGPNGNSIFLPAAGSHDGTSFYNTQKYGYYWSSMPDESDKQYAYTLLFNSGYYDWYWSYRYYGRSVRPVSE